VALCGREDEVRVILSHCAARRFVVLTSAPGLGKTTLLEEGIIPALQKDGWVAVAFRGWQGKDFAAEFKEALAAAVRESGDLGFFTQTETLSEMPERIRTRTGLKVALILDQLEDYVRCHSGSDRADSFDAELSHAIAGRECTFVAALQTHALDRFRRLEQYIPNFLGFHVELGPLPAEAARELLQRYGAERGAAFDPAVLDALVAAPAAAFEGGVHPFFLKAAAARLLDAADGRDRSQITAAAIEAYGGADRLILESLDPALQALNPTHTELFFRWCNLLISPDGSRLAVTKEALVDYSGKLNRFALTLIPALIEAGLVRSVEAEGTLRYEIAREPMTPMIRDWWHRREAAITARRRAKFRVRSLSVAAGSIVALYALWLILTMRR
jgi:hypothetical protein